MQPEDVKAMLEAGIPGAEVKVSGDGSHFDVTIVSPEFEGKTMVQEQQMVNTILYDKITSGEIHAINIKAYTPEEWKSASKLQLS
ncbi:MAG: BolA family protein [Pseudomonadota bacterium]